MKGRFVLSLLILLFATSAAAQTTSHKLQSSKHPDVSTTAPSNGQCMVYVSATGRWTPGSCSTGSGDFLSDGSVAMTGAPVPTSAGGVNIGSATAEWGHIYLHDAKSIYFQADQSVYLTSGAGTLTLTGATLLPAAATQNLGGTANEWGNLYMGDAKVIYGQADQSNTITSSATGWIFNKKITVNNAILEGGTNTFNITNGTASLDVAAGATLNIDKSLQVATGAVVLNGNAGGSSVLTLPNQTTVIGTLTDGKWCSYASSGTTLSCTQDAPAGSGDVTDVGDCSGGACYDGSSDGGTYARLYDGTSAYSSITAGVGTLTFAHSGADRENLILTLGNNNNTVSLTSGTGANILTATSFDASFKSVSTTAATTTGGYIRLMEGSDNGTDYSSITGAADAGSYPAFIFSGSQGSEDLVLTASNDLWTFSSTTGAKLAVTPALTLTGGITSIGAAANLSGGTVTLGTIAGAIDAGGATSLEIPNGASPTVDAAGEIAIDTTSDQLVYYGGAKRVIPYKQFLSFVIPAPAATDDINLLKAPYGMTILAINCIVQGTTSVTGQLQECSATGGDCADLDSDITCDADGAADDGTLTDSAIASAAWLRWKTTSVSGTPTFLTVTVTYSVVSD